VRINYTLLTTRLNGGVRGILEIANHLVERGHDVSITAMGDPPETAWFPLRGRVIYVPDVEAGWRQVVRRSRFLKQAYLRNPWLQKSTAAVGIRTETVSQFERASKALAAAIPDCDFSVATHCMTAFPVIDAGKGTPYYHMQHHEVVFFDDPSLKHRAEASYRLSLHAIANSSWLKHTVERSYGHRDVAVVHGAVNHSTFFPRPRPPRNGKFRVISLGRSERWKGFPELLQAMRIVMRSHPVEWIVYSTTRPPYTAVDAPFQFMESPSGSDLAELYSLCDIAVNPSWYESFPLPPIEAMACGVAVVTTPYGTEDYAKHELTALVTPPRDVDSLAISIIRLLEDRELRVRLGEAGREESLRFTWANSAASAERAFMRASQHSA
jgi:glycosyltransferase involved in cell wall biosynthesis